MAGAPAQVIDGLEQRHDTQRAALHAGGIGKEPGVFGQQVDPQNVVGAFRHGEHEGADRLAVELRDQGLQELKELQRIGGLFRQPGKERQAFQRPRQLGGQPAAPGL